MDAICHHMGISRQAHYQRRQREVRTAADEQRVLLAVSLVRRRHPRMGGRKLWVQIRPMLAQEGLNIGRDRLFALLKAHDLLITPQKSSQRTTWAGKWRAPNRLAGSLITAPDQAWVADITYLDMAYGGFLYAFVLMDLYSRYIVGWHVADSLAAEQAVIALEMALQQAPRPLAGLIHHSDHGAQYGSKAYRQCLEHHGIQASMGEVGNAYDNAYAERVLGTLKREYALNSTFTHRQQTEAAVAQAVYLYNMERPHLSLAYATPVSAYRGDVLAQPVKVLNLQQENRG